MTATVVAMRKPDPTADRQAAKPATSREVLGCGGQDEPRGSGVRAAGLCVVCGRITVHRHPSGLPACEGAAIPVRVLEAAGRSEALRYAAKLRGEVL